MAEFDTVAIVGVGLIGGSIGFAVRERKLARQVIGIGRHEGSLAIARRLGAVDTTTTSLAEGVKQAQLVVVCTPVDKIVDYVCQAAAASQNRSLITDAGSTKQAIIEGVEVAVGGPPRRTAVRGQPSVGGRPSHRRRACSRRLVRRSQGGGYAVGEDTPRGGGGDWRVLAERSARDVVVMSPAEHDEALAAASHLPHLIAAALALSTPKELLPLAASGWRDTTRIAGGDPDMWRAIFATNRQEVLAALKRFECWTNEIREILTLGQDERLLRLLERAQWMKANRDALGD